MARQKIIEEFFKEELQTSGGYSIYTNLFLYKDKQLLKENRLKEFAERQIDKAKNIFWAVSFSVFIATFYSFWHLIQFGQGWHWSDLTIGLVLWAGLIYILIKACKEYYTITSSMTLFIKLLDEEQADGIE
ncbi:hypothetical protein CK503_00060 [Aliifodinibius salipaludis]|uniref:Uncharacterized protein n=1 Tax=Fodinibius salipaludis TaxID=2032627 RepID=A0A2A2GF43_9BACT|nr:hypothetical protein [Aliifodinibius salipaludis]PAU95495.1 hypothetical protein CK503_00060 [Aliifodinibius salipaludis]